ncbi:MAG: Cna B-type domain-containing protein [Firmicutes bacterium]|nr:Cna B-type domain-containing protein [Bacillota bacterium]
MRTNGKYGKAKIRQNWRRRLTGVLAGIIVFTTTYSLILPAITLDESAAENEPGIVLNTPEESSEAAAEIVEVETVEEAEEEAAEPAGKAEATEEAEAPAESSDEVITEEAETSQDISVSEDGSEAEDAAAAENSEEETAAPAESSEEVEVAAESSVEEIVAVIENSKEETAAPAESSEEVEVAAESTVEENSEEESAAPAEVVVEYPAQDFEAEAGDIKVTVSAPEGAFPAGTTMTAVIVEDEEILTAASEAVEGEARSIYAVDIIFRDVDGTEIEPLQPVRVSMSSAVVKEAEAIEVVHVDDEGLAEVVSQAEDAETADDEVVFDTDGFSVYVIVETEVITVDYLTADGETYTITVEVPESAKIPEGTILDITEIPAGTSEYADYLTKSKEIIGEGELSFARMFDINLVYNGKKIEPECKITVYIELNDSIALAEGTRLYAVHFGEEGTEKLSVSTVGSSYGTMQDVTEVSFSTNGLSPIVITGTEAYPTVSLTATSTRAANDTITVAVEGAGDTTEITIPLGEFSDNADALTIDGYTFVEGWYNSIKINGIYKDDDGGIYFGTIEGNTVTGVVIDLANVTLKYEETVVSHNVTFEVVVDGTVSSAAGRVDIAGASTLKEGHEYDFSAVAQNGYSISSVTTSSGAVASGSGSTYILTGATEDTTITINLNEQTLYNGGFTFAGSNTRLTYNGTSYNSWNGSNHDYVRSFNYTATETFAFTLGGTNEWSNLTKVMNQLSITVDGDAQAVSIPDVTGSTETTTLRNGYVVTVTKTSAGQYPTYSVTITNPDADNKVRGQIHIQTNFKDVSSSEVWAKQLDGVEPLAYKKTTGNNTTGFVTADGQGDQNSRLQPEVYTFYSRDTSNSSYYFVKLDGTYNVDDLYLTVVNYNASSETTSNVISEIKVSSLATISGLGNRIRNYLTTYTNYTTSDYYFTIPSGTTNLTDIRIYIVYKPNVDDSTKFTVWFDNNDGTAIYQDSNSNGEYTRVQNKVISLADTPTRSGYVFDGWYLGSDSDTLYQPGDLFTLSADALSAADSEHRMIFKAKWTPETEAVYANYKINVFLEGDDGTYPETPDLTTTERGNIGSTAYIISDEFDNWLDTRLDDGWREIYEYDRQTTDTPIAADGSTELNIYYRHKMAELTFVPDTGVDHIVVTMPDGTVITGASGESVIASVKIRESGTITAQAIASDGYVVNGWHLSTSDGTLLTDATSFNPTITDVAGSTEWTDRTYVATAETARSITVTKIANVLGTIDMTDLDTTIYLVVWDHTRNENVKNSDGTLRVETIQLIDGVPQGTAVFDNLREGVYSVWEVTDETGETDLSAGTKVMEPDVVISKIETKSGVSETNRADLTGNTLNDDGYTVTNTYNHESDVVNWTITKAWYLTKNDTSNPTTDIPSGYTATLSIYRQDAQDTALQTVVLDGTVDTNGEAEPWKATFEELPVKDHDGNAINYIVKETAFTPEQTSAGEYITAFQDSVSNDGGTIRNGVIYGNLTLNKSVNAPGINDLSEYISGMTITVTGPHGYSQEVTFEGAGPRYTATLTDLPAGNYTVEETDQETMISDRKWIESESSITTANNRDFEELGTMKISFDIADGVPNDTAIVNLVNDYTNTDITVTKVWDDKGTVVTDHPDVSITLKRTVGETEETISTQSITDEENLTLTWSQMPQQYSYSVEEAPVYGYDSTVSGDKINGFTVTNTKRATGTLTLTKIVEGADAAKEITYTITLTPKGFAQNATTYELKPTSGNDSIVITDLPIGSYTVTEVLTGADIDDYDRVTVISDGTNTNEYTSPAAQDVEIVEGDNTVTVTNKYTLKTEPVSFKKVDQGHQDKVLEGAIFTMTYEDGTEYTLTSTDGIFWAVDAEGNTIKELPVGKYSITETTAPEGYNKAGAIEVNVATTGVTYTQVDNQGGEPQTAELTDDHEFLVIITNTSGAGLPNTGGPGTLLYTLSGLALMLGAALMYGFRMRRRERRLS